MPGLRAMQFAVRSNTKGNVERRMLAIAFKTRRKSAGTSTTSWRRVS